MKVARRCVSCNGARLDRVSAILMPFIAVRVFGWEPVEITSEWGFRDIPAGHACSVCNSVGCEDCGMLFLDMRFDDEEMAALYNDYRGPAYSAMRERFEPGYVERNAIYGSGSGYIPQIEAFLQPHVPRAPRVLDWGGDSGLNTPFRSTAAVHHVYDISGCPVIEGAQAIDRNQIERNDYDLITYMQVLEHVPSPRDSLSEIVAAMKRHTQLYIELPLEESVRSIDDPRQRLLSKRHWHEHINFFTPKSLETLIRDVGLVLVHQATHVVSAGGKDGHIYSLLTQRAA